MKKEGPAIYLETDGGQMIEIILVDESGAEQRLPAVTPAEDLLSVLTIDYSEYRNAVSGLWETHSLFEERNEVHVSDHRDMIEKALAIPAMLKDRDPTAYHAVSARLNEAVRRLPERDDNSAIFLLRSGGDILRILADPIRTQIRLRNIFEVAFDGMERATQRERYEKLTRAYPELLTRFYHSRWLEAEDGSLPLSGRVQYVVGTLYQLRVLELLLHFRQDAQRIARCEYCWGYFIPKTKRQTCYCDRRFGNKTCKQLGPNLKRNVGPELDEALHIFDVLYHRMAARRDRYEEAPPGERESLIQMNDLEFDRWSRGASEARMKYLRQEITASEFLRQVDLFHELQSYAVGPRKLLPQSDWQIYGSYHIDFDPAKAFEPIQFIDLGTENPQWRIITREEQIERAQEGHRSLREKYGTKEDAADFMAAYFDVMKYPPPFD